MRAGAPPCRRTPSRRRSRQELGLIGAGVVRPAEKAKTGIPACRAAETPTRLSSTTRHCSGAIWTVLAACRNRSGMRLARAPPWWRGRCWVRTARAGPRCRATGGSARASRWTPVRPSRRSRARSPATPAISFMSRSQGRSGALVSAGENPRTARARRGRPRPRYIRRLRLGRGQVGDVGLVDQPSAAG